MMPKPVARRIEERWIARFMKMTGATREEAMAEWPIFLESVKKSVKAIREGDVIPWSAVKKELGL